MIGEIATMCMAIYGFENPAEFEMKYFLSWIEEEVKSQIPDMDKISEKCNEIKSLVKDDRSDFNSFIGSMTEAKNITLSQYNYLLDQYYSNILLSEIDDLESKLQQKYEEIKDLKESHQINALTHLGLDLEQAKNIEPDQYDFLKEHLAEILLQERKEENLQEKLQKSLQKESLQKELSEKLKEKYEEIKDGLTKISSDESKNISESYSGILELKDHQQTVQKIPTNSTTNRKVPALNLTNIGQLNTDNASSRKASYCKIL